MQKIVALTCVVAWSGFWTFGYLALSAGTDQGAHASVAALLAAVGFLTGTFTYMRLGRNLQG